VNKRNFEKLSFEDKAYPISLRRLSGSLLPPDLWVAGNLGLLGRSSVGFCGSRKATEYGLTVAADCAEQLTDHDIVVTSGYAAGVDMAAHISALRSGGSTIIVLAEGSNHFRIKRDIRDHWDWDRVLVLSYFPPEAVWRADRAMGRNKAIVLLSGAVIVIEAGESGGTLNAGYVTLKEGKPLFVASYGDMDGTRSGNRRLIEEGGVPLMKSRETGKAQVNRILRSVAH